MHRAGQGGEEVAHVLEIYLEQLGHGQGEHRHPDEDADDIVPSEVLESRFGPIEEEHPGDDGDIYRRDDDGDLLEG